MTHCRKFQEIISYRNRFRGGLENVGVLVDGLREEDGLKERKSQLVSTRGR